MNSNLQKYIEKRLSKLNLYYNRIVSVDLSWLEQLICNQQVVGSSPSIGSTKVKIIDILGRYSSGQRGQTVNLLVFTFAGSNPALPTPLIL